MRVELADPVQYYLRLGDEELNMNALIGHEIEMSFDGRINCINCGVQTKTSFGQGFCFKCFKTAPQAAECILKPELCRAHLGEGRDAQWEEEHHNQPHYVYLALSSAVKVGVTRATQIPIRWIDQGATAAIKVAETPNRYLAGKLEVALKELFTDKTSWQRMLKNEVLEGVDLVEEKWQLEETLPSDLIEWFVEDDEITEIHYPVEEYPKKVKSVNFDKQDEIEGILTGIKGQYLLFEDNRVMNIRRHNGYYIELEVD